MWKFLFNTYGLEWPRLFFIKSMRTLGCIMFAHGKKKAWNQDNHQCFYPTLLVKTLWLVFMTMKQEKQFFFWKKNFLNGRLIKTEIFKTANSRNFLAKILWIDPWLSSIDWCEGHWCGLTYMVVRLKNSLNTQKVHFCLFLSLCWTVSPLLI